MKRKVQKKHEVFMHKVMIINIYFFFALQLIYTTGWSFIWDKVTKGLLKTKNW